MEFLSVFSILAVIAIFVLFIYLEVNKGKIGELTVARILSRLSPEYKVYNDIIIPSFNGTSQIDHIVISPYGIFVIETKNYSGKIYGGENSDHWKQYLRNVEYEMINPIKQNSGHISALKKLFYGLPEIPYHSIIVFAGSADLYINVSTAHVLFDDALLNRIKDLSESTTFRTAINQYVERLESRKIEVTRETVHQHKENARNAVRQHNLKVANGVCPRCGGQLIKRKGKYGLFLGCSNYPKCDYTSNI